MKHAKQIIIMIVWILNLVIGSSFAKSKITEMEQLDYMIGQWHMISYESTNDNKMKEGKTVPMIGAALLDDYMIELNTHMDFGNSEKSWMVPVKMIFSYDQFNKTYRLIIMDGGYGFTSFYSGNYKEEKLVLTDLKSETTVQTDTGTVVGRSTIIKKNNNNFEIDMEVSSDSGKTFGPYGQYHFKRIK